MYDLVPMRAPRTSGWQLELLAALVEHPLSGPWLAEYLLQRTGLPLLRQARPTQALPVLHPLLAAYPAVPPGEWTLPALTATAGSGPFAGIADYERAYRAGASPVAVAERIVGRDLGNLAVFIAQDAADVRAQAEASAARWAAGQPLGPLDGVPIAVKDELDQAGYPTTVGTKFLGDKPATADAEVVRRLRAAGAVLIGKTNMHEIGMGATGQNAHHGTARNPYNPAHATGGSSSGSASAVALGLCPAAVGADGGGSIRIPASFCGVVGLKPTFGRVSERGAAPLCWSVAHIGPLAASAADAALLYQAMAGPDPADPATWHQPAPAPFRFELQGLRLGIFRPWFADADPAIVAACEAVVAALVARGARVVEVSLPNLGAIATAHMVTIASEMATACTQRREEHAPEIRLNLALASRLRGTDYAQAQRVRARAYEVFMAALAEADVILTPSTGCVAPPAPERAESDLELLDRIMRFARPANLTGLPAISFPAGYDPAGLPIGMQAIGRPWEEQLLLELARVAEEAVPRRVPALYQGLS